MRHPIGEEPKFTVSTINSRVHLIRAAITTVPTMGDAMANTPAERGAVRYLGPRFCSGGCLDKITQAGEDAGYWRENRSASDNILPPVRDNTSTALASYDAVSEASVTVLYQRLRTLLLLDPPTPEFMFKMRRVVANSGMRALGLAPMNEELDNAATVFLLARHWLGGGGMGDPVIKCVQDSAITILAGLQYDSVFVRANLLAHAEDRTRNIFSVRGDQTAARRVKFVRNHAEMKIHRGKQYVPAPRHAFRYQPSPIFSHNDFSFNSKEMLKDTVFQYLPPRDQIVLTQEPENNTSTSTWRALPVEALEAQKRAQSSTMVPGILWIGLNARGKQQFMTTGCVKYYAMFYIFHILYNG